MNLKLKNGLLAAAVALSFAACNNEDLPNNGGNNATNGNTYAGMHVKILTSSTRNVTQNDEPGRTQESKLTSLQLLSVNGDQTWTAGTADQDGKFWDAGSGVYTVKPWKTTAGNQDLALIFNKQTSMTPTITNTQSYTFGRGGTDAITDIAAASTDDAFVMTSGKKQVDVKADKDEETVKAGTNGEADNVFSVDVERIVAQGMVAKASSLNGDTKDGKGSVDITSLTYAAVNGAVPTYLMGDNAGNRTMDNSTMEYTNFTSAIHEYTDFQNAKDAATAGAKLIRLGNLLPADGGTNENLGNYKAISVAENETAAKKARGIYFFENSVKKTNETENDIWTAENKDYGFYRLAYAKVYATFTPKKVLTYNESKKALEEVDITKGTTFYKGEKDGLLYKTKADAKKSTITGAKDQKAYTYTNGKCAYRALWNRQMNGKTLVNADVRRNNIYLLEIDGFQGLGMPWDSSDDKDPNLPKPTDPEEPTNPENPDVEQQDTYMRVTSKVLQWNYVKRSVTLN